MRIKFNFWRIVNYKYPLFFETLLSIKIKRKIKNDFVPNSYIFFENPARIESFTLTHSEYLKQLRIEYERSFLLDKSHFPYEVFNYYAGRFYTHINDYLRGFKEFSDNDFITSRVAIMENEFEKLVIKENLVVVRRVPKYFIYNYLLNGNKIKSGSKMKDAGFMSTSLDLSYRKDNESVYKPIVDEALIFIKIPRNFHAVYLEEISRRQEFELLLPTNTEIIVEEKYSILGNLIVFSKVI